jgi:hypothetical protein
LALFLSQLLAAGHVRLEFSEVFKLGLLLQKAFVFSFVGRLRCDELLFEIFLLLLGMGFNLLGFLELLLEFVSLSAEVVDLRAGVG